MRILETHKTNACNEALLIVCDDRDPSCGNASHNYTLSFASKGGGLNAHHVMFQHGPIKEVGVNGITHEALLAILIDRFEGFQSGHHKCLESNIALFHLNAALDQCKKRTAQRVERGVEGTHEL